MKKEIVDIDLKKGIVRVTTADERWYLKPATNTETLLPEYKAVPSVTWIAGHYPKGIGFYKWLADRGWDESQAVKNAAGDKGSKVHQAISTILNGEEVRYDSKFCDSSGQEVELTFEEADIIQSFLDWRDSLESFEPITWDLTLFSDQLNYAGSTDLIAYVNGELTLIDFKTSQEVWTEYELQISAYAYAIQNGENPLYYKNKQVNVSELKLAILQVGYKRNNNRYKWNEIMPDFEMFLVAQKIWKKEREKEKGLKGYSQKDYPIILSPAKEDLMPEEESVIVYEGGKARETITIPKIKKK